MDPEGEFADFINHSCAPNSYIIKKGDELFVFALTEIARGEEILVDYSTVIADDDSWTMKCNCGEKECRGIVEMLSQLPQKTRKEYLSAGMVPRYVFESQNLKI